MAIGGQNIEIGRDGYDFQPGIDLDVVASQSYEALCSRMKAAAMRSVA